MSVTSELVEQLKDLDTDQMAEFVAGLSDDELLLVEEAVKVVTYQHDPVRWVQDVLSEHLWSKQQDILRSVVDNRYTAVHSAHDTGKSFTASCAAAWWIDVHELGEAFLVSTAPTFPQVRAILWREIRQRHRRGKLPGRVNQTDWLIDETLVGFGRKPADYDVAAFQGIHARYVLIVIDEAGGVPKSIFDAVDALATNIEARVLAIGNPDDPLSHFAEVCKPGSGWNVIHVDGLDSPNFTSEEIPESLRPLLLSPEWVDERKLRWGEDSALYISKVRGLFPESSSDGVVPLSWIRQCQLEEPGPSEIVELGLDVGASVEGDETVIYEAVGNAAGRYWTLRTDEPEQIVGEAVKRINETNARAIKVDVIGVGFGIAGWLEKERREGHHNAKVVKVNVSTSSREPKRFPNLRSQIWWEIGRELSESQGWNLKNADDDVVAQLIAPKYSLDSHGRTVVEKKADTRERLGRSPDLADALLLAFYRPHAHAAKTSSPARAVLPQSPISTR